MALELKSARTIDTVEEISKLLREINEKDGAVRAAKGNAIAIDKDGAPVVTKQAATVMTLSSPPDLSPEEIESHARAAGITFVDAHRERVISYWASDERVDGDGDIIRQKWDFSRYEKNPVLCLSHDWYDPPVGSGIKWGVVSRSDADYSGPALFIACLFPTLEENARADSVFRLLKSGFLRGGSVGFRGKRITRIEDPEERAALGLGPWGVIFEECMLLEFSPTTIGSNPGAHTSLAAAKKAGTLIADDVPVMREIYRQESVARHRKAEEWADADANLVAVCKSLFPDRGFKRHADMAAPIVEKDSPAVAVPAPAASDVASDVKAIRATLDDLGPAILRRLDDLQEENADLRRRLEAIEARGEAADDAGAEDPPAPTIEPKYEIPDTLLSGLASLRAGT